jgi:hypothetical protein
LIPPILHQTWSSDTLPERFSRMSDSWLKHNPGWTRILWSDRMLLEFVAEQYPDFLATYTGYPNGVMRADAGRYLLLHHFGGVYADIDCECVAAFDPIMGEDRAVFCLEPASHSPAQASIRGMPRLIFNGTMASPKGHPFWPHLMSYLPDLASAKEVLDATGPCVLTSAQASFGDQSSLVIHPSALFAPLDRDLRAPAGGDEGPRLSVHYWAGTWWSPGRKPRLKDHLRLAFYRARYLATRGKQMDAQAACRSIDPAVVAQPAPRGGNIAVLVPMRDAADHIEPFLRAMDTLDWPKERIKLVFCEGDSVDGSWERLQAAVAPLAGRYRAVTLLQRHLGTALDRSGRWKPALQRARRSGIAAIRNHLIAHGLDASDDWALWIDIDVWRFPRDIIQTLTGTGHRIVVPNCVKRPGGGSFDMNTFITTLPQRDHRYYKHTLGGLYQPPTTFIGRLYLSDVRHLERVPLDAVGGTVLMVDAALHRAGLTFPELPYRDLIETEGFGAWAKDLGIPPLGLPRVEVFHVPW